MLLNISFVFIFIAIGLALFERVLGLKQKDMAEHLGISAQYLGMLERGDQPLSEPVAMKMQELYGFSAEWILFGKGQHKIQIEEE